MFKPACQRKEQVTNNSPLAALFTHFQNKECSQTISLSYLITNDRPLIP